MNSCFVTYHSEVTLDFQYQLIYMEVLYSSTSIWKLTKDKEICNKSLGASQIDALKFLHFNRRAPLALIQSLLTLTLGTILMCLVILLPYQPTAEEKAQIKSGTACYRQAR